MSEEFELRLSQVNIPLTTADARREQLRERAKRQPRDPVSGAFVAQPRPVSLEDVPRIISPQPRPLRLRDACPWWVTLALMLVAFECGQLGEAVFRWRR